jgi:peroxiredoxin
MLSKGGKAPNFSLLNADGAESTLESVLSKGRVLLAFFKISCPTCQLALPFIERLYQSGQIAVVGISQDDAADTKEFSDRFGLTFPMLLDSPKAKYPASNAFKITNVPSLFLVSEGRVIDWTLQGFSRRALEELGAELHAPVFRIGDQVPELKPG